MTLDLIADHQAAALDRLLQQDRDQANTEALVSALVLPAQELEQALFDLYTERGVDTADGAQLDVLGEIVGQPRNGLSDDDYRRYLRARVATNRSHGHYEDLILIANLILNDPNAYIQVEQQNTASVVVRIISLALTPELAEVIMTFLRDAVGAGIRILLEFSEGDDDDTFYTAIATFADGAIPDASTEIDVDSTADFPATGSIDIDVGLSVEETQTYGGKTATQFIDVSTTDDPHVDRTAVQLSGSPGKGFGDDSSPTVGGQFASVIE